MVDVVIFGVSDTAQLAFYYLNNDSDFNVVAFCVDQAYLPEDRSFMGLPAMTLEQVTRQYPASDYQFLVPMTAADMNRLRANIYHRIKKLGYQFISYVSSHATVLTDNIGENCFILENNTLQPYCTIEDNVMLWSGNHIGHHSRVRAHAFISSHVVVSGRCEIGEYSYIGVNSTLRDGLKIAEGSFIGMGSSVTKHTEAWNAYAGTPAKNLRKKSTDINIYHELD